MEAIGRLTGGVAHDFNNMLTIVRASVDLLRRPGLSEEKRTRYFNAIAETADRAALLTGQLLTFARRQPMRPERFDVAERIRGLEQIIVTSVGSPVEVALELGEGMGLVEADPTQFDTAILNIVINARDAMPAGGALRIAVEAVPNLPSRSESSLSGRGYVAISIRDNGTGIESTTLQRIFEPFFTTKAVNKGTGLGLSQVYGFIKQSGGDIDVASKLGEGSTFTLYLPRAANRTRPARARKDVRPIVDDPILSILLVEDNEEVGEFARLLLTELEQHVTWVTHGRAALDFLESQRDEVDIVFSDIVMPGISGLELAQEIRKQWPDLPVVLTSGYSDALATEGSHGFELLHKPYSAEGILGMLRRHAPESTGKTRAS
jgi:CheY-like chemotaxis protein